MPTAEHAIRWDPSQGGPQHLSQVAQALGLREGKWKHMSVRYFKVEGPDPLPEGFRLIGRERTGPEGTECMVKLRGPGPLPNSLLNWVVPLQGKVDEKQEFDVSWGPGGQVSSALSVSGTVTAASLQHALSAGYIATSSERSHLMVRLKDKAGGITVEAWHLHNGRHIFEVSGEGVVEQHGLPAQHMVDPFFSRVVQPLVQLGAKPLADGLTTLAEQG
ncbi:hypothetical protein [Ideonella sp.]|jgi:hypothetical protein|uniref:hypothetical protein n=1 Tax=Ideonella sp. TaxID=1929293 RepID=UPI0037C07675